MSAEKLTDTDWQYIFNQIKEGYAYGQFHSLQLDGIVYSGWWSLTKKGIIIEGFEDRS